MKNSKAWIFLKGVIAENPVLVLILGTCPVLAQSTSIVNAVSMGLAATIVLVCSNMVISALRKVIPDAVRIPCYIVVIAGFVSAVQLLLHATLPPIYEMMGVYLALIVVNCIILGRAEMFARKNKILDSALDGLGMGLGFLVALLAMALIREIFGGGTVLSGLEKFGFDAIRIPFIYEHRIPILQKAPGGFFVYGVVIAIVNMIGPKKGEKKRRGESLGCAGCPSAAVCGRESCDSAPNAPERAGEA